ARSGHDLSAAHSGDVRRRARQRGGRHGFCSMTRRALLLGFSISALVGCDPEVPVGSDTPPSVLLDCPTPSALGCPAAPWGARVVFASPSTLEQRLVGRWVFCGGQRRYTGRGALSGIPNGTGIEFWEDAGELRYAFLS